MLLSYCYRMLFCEKPDSTFSQHALEPHRLMGDVDAALMQQVFHIPQRQRVAHLHHHREADDLGARLEIPENAGVAHTIEGNSTLPGGNRSFNLTLPSGLRSD
ncbi:MAG: hypothetical protein IOC56_09655 [Methylobacterium sp.]|nr:hypothetical protein [Methylobacterium sp.]